MLKTAETSVEFTLSIVVFQKFSAVAYHLRNYVLPILPKCKLSINHFNLLLGNVGFDTPIGGVNVGGGVGGGVGANGGANGQGGAGR